MITAFYGEGGLAPEALSPQVLKNIEDSGFTTVIFGLFHIGRPQIEQELGEVIFNGSSVVRNGQLNAGFSNWSAQISQLRSGNSQVKKIYFSFGGGFPVVDFGTIANQIMQKDASGWYIPKDSWLYKNFEILANNYKDVIDGIDIDQEEGIDEKYTNAMAAFGKMAFDLGFKEVTFVPPFSSYLESYRSAAEVINAHASKNGKSGYVTRLGLQFYSGGFSTTDITAWSDAAAKIGASGHGPAPTLLLGAIASPDSPNTAAEVQSTMSQYPSPRWSGGFIWRFEYIEKHGLADYNQAILGGVKS